MPYVVGSDGTVQYVPDGGGTGPVGPNGAVTASPGQGSPTTTGALPVTNGGPTQTGSPGIGTLLAQPTVHQAANGEWIVIAPDGSVTHTGTFGAPPNVTSSSSNNTSTSSSTNQSLADPAQLAQQATQFAQSLAQSQATLKATIQNNKALQAQAAATQAFLNQKESFAESISSQTLLNETQQQQFNQQQAIATLGIQEATLNNQWQTTNAQLAQAAQVANANNALAAQQLNQQAEQSRQANLLKTNEDIATDAQNPTDYGKLAAFELANRGWGQAADNSGTANLTSQQSLQPLANDLNLQKTLQQPITPYVPPQIVAPQIGTPNLAGIALPTAGASGAAPIAPTVTSSGPSAGWGQPGYAPIGQTPATATASNPNNTLSSLNLAALVGGNTSVLGGTDYAAAAQTPSANAGSAQPTAGGTQGGLQGEKKGGPTVGAYKSGEAGDEINIPMIINGKPGAYVIPHHIVAKMKAGDIKRLKGFVDGGIFSGGSGIDLGSLTDTAQAQNFLGQTYRNGVAGIPGVGNIPTPVYASSPGFNPDVTALFGSLAATAGRGPLDFYQQQAANLAPTGYAYNPIARQQPVGRSA